MQRPYAYYKQHSIYYVCVNVYDYNRISYYMCIVYSLSTSHCSPAIYRDTYYMCSAWHIGQGRSSGHPITSYIARLNSDTCYIVG